MQTNETFIYQTEQIRDFERLASERFGISGHVMMQRAGKSAFDYLLQRWPNAKKIAIFCGAGNNGGDGYVLAQFAHEQGLQVEIWQVGKQNNMKNEVQEAYEVCCANKLPIAAFNDNIDLSSCDLIVDAICGIGLQDGLRDEVLVAIKKIQQSNLPVLAIDMPTGVNADTGYVATAALRAAATITFIGLKLGLLTSNGTTYAGDIILHDLQLPPELFVHSNPSAAKINFDSYSSYLKKRPRDWHKGLSGHVLVVGGALGFSGAPRMAAIAALRVGAGLVSVATHPEHVEVMNASYPELICHGVTKAADLQPLIAKSNVIVLGPGLNQTTWSREIWEMICRQPLPLVIDADGLNLLAQTKLQFNCQNWLLTPHPAEAARLLHSMTQTVQKNRLEALQALVKKYACVCVLKGAGSLISSPDSLPALCDKGNPGMSTAGMGDILSGVIGGLIAQGIPLLDAAKLGVYMHALAGDLAAKDGERGMIATDLLPYLRQIANA